MNKLTAIDWIAWLLVVIGGLNWGLVGAFDFNLVEKIFGVGTITMIVYILVGLSAIWMLILGPKLMKK
ncbi:MAG: DUF378 domain-containing protein [Candidatus Yanofskybacteria bacterium RIFCSPLOWO2_02_FULL_45_10]|uniref:DUF378 domain-containing protein n=2 Tax=Candidatus Yanofskyibacteriota TaxID=1752733 RepID=A0A1F8G731_9BACT|nr:MAG: DUF378 domain-containing protein [Candidatus Yanofskybacteria bacterium RIFCSPHIGHO2_12_FULL_45_19b]OGN32525.1 MAG: DUF378 domain-containing protein [Candidatus Yanofskybacteria bacterium RIFCSPLOWO2_02_FULL_45_10]